MQAVHPQAAAKDVGESKIVSSPLTVRQEGLNDPPVESLRITTPKD